MKTEIFTLLDARAERYAAEARIEAIIETARAKAEARFARTKAGRALAERRALRWIPPQYEGGAVIWNARNR